MEQFEVQGTEQEFLDKYKSEEIQKYDKPSVTVDCVMLRYNQGNVEMLMIKRKTHPFQGKYALPGGFVNKDEDLKAAVIREVQEETSVVLNPNQVEQLMTVGTPNRDPRHWIITVAHLVFLEYGTDVVAQAGDDADDVMWVSIDSDENGMILSDGNSVVTKEMIAFDHYEIIQEAHNRIKGRLDYKPTVLTIMPTHNTILAYRMLYGKFNNHYKNMNSSTFSRIFSKFFTQQDVKVETAGRPAKLYTWEVK